MGIKWLGAAAVIFACGAYGYKCYFDKTKRVRTITELLTALEMFIQQISCTLAPLAEALKVKEESIFSEAAKQIENGADFPGAFSAVLKSRHELTEMDKRILTAFSEGLSAQDKDGQISNARLCKERLQTALTEAKQEAVKSGKLYKSGGVLIGVLIALIMF